MTSKNNDTAQMSFLLRPRHGESYTCPELGQTCLRPGAYDAYSLPSVVQGRLVYPRNYDISKPNPLAK